jgi:hypothetical protein
MPSPYNALEHVRPILVAAGAGELADAYEECLERIEATDGADGPRLSAEIRTALDLTEAIVNILMRAPASSGGPRQLDPESRTTQH